jgi:hypothetical protein
MSASFGQDHEVLQLFVTVQLGLFFKRQANGLFAGNQFGNSGLASGEALNVATLSVEGPAAIKLMISS